MVLVAPFTVGQLSAPQRRQERRVTTQNTEVTLAPGCNDLVDHVRHDEAHWCGDLEGQRVGHSALAAELLGLVHRLADVADHVERLLGQVVVFAVHDFPEALDRVGDLHVAPRQARELLGHEHRLRQETLDLAGAADDLLVLVRELFHAEDGDDVLQILVALQDRLHGPRGLVVLLPEDVRVEDARGRRERVDGRVDAELGDLPREHARRVEVGKRRRRRRIRDVVGRNVDRLHRGDRSLLRRRDALLERAHLGGQRGLVADRRRHPAEERRDFGAGLREPEDVVDEEEHVLSLFVPEILGGRERRERDPQPRSRRLSHLAEDQRRLLDDARLLHLVIQVVALASTLADAGEHRNSTVLLGDVVDQLLDEHRLPDAGAAEQSRLAALRVGLEQIDDLDAGLEHLDLGGLSLEVRRRAMDRIRLLGVDRRTLVHRLTDDVEDAAERLLADGHRNGAAGVGHSRAPGAAVGGGHGGRAHLALAQLLGNLEHELLRIGEDVLVLDARHLERVVDRGQFTRLELDVDHRADDLDDLPLNHASAPCLSASAPPTISSNSLVIFSWRALLYWIVRTSIISLAFLVAASMAVMRAPYSPARDSISARYTCMRT